MRRALLPCLLQVLALAACGGNDTRGGGADAGTANDAAPSGIAPPAPPALPVFEPCPEGFAAVADGDGLTVCEPPDFGASCADGEVRFPGDAACAPVGGACPAGDWPEPEALPPATSVLYVRPMALGGTGDRARPFGTIREAMTRATPGTLIALARGTYTEPVVMYGGVTLAGACAAETILAPTRSSSVDPAVDMQELDSALMNLTVAPVAGSGVLVGGRGRIEGVIVASAEISAISLLGGELTVRDTILRGTRLGPGTDVGRGMSVENGATATVERTVFADNASGAVFASDESTVVSLDHVVMRGNGAGIDSARAMALQDGPRLEMRRSLVEDQFGAGASVLGVATLVLEDVVLRRFQRPVVGDGSSLGIAMNEGARLEATRVRIEGSETMALGALVGSTVVVHDVAIRDITGDVGVALGVAMGASAEVRRLFIARATAGGLVGSGAGGVVDVEDLSVVGTGQDRSGSGFAIAFDDGTTGTIRRARVSTSRGAGLMFGEAGTSLAVEDLVIEDTESLLDGTLGRAIEIQNGASARFTRAVIERSREVSVLAIAGSSLELEDVRIVESRARGCADTTCAHAPGGTGIGSYGGSSVRATRFAVDEARLCGVQVAGDSGLDLAAGEISGAAVGACVQVAGFDIARITTDVRYQDNDIAVDSTEHAVPEPAMPLPAF